MDLKRIKTGDIGVSLYGGTPISHLKMMIFSRKTHGCWGNPPFSETPILASCLGV